MTHPLREGLTRLEQPATIRRYLGVAIAAAMGLDADDPFDATSAEVILDWAAEGIEKLIADPAPGSNT